MKIIGLSGGVASGKNFVADIFAKNGAAIFDADKEVHELLALDKSVIAAVKKNFLQSFIDGKIDRKILGKIVFSDARKLKILERIIHPKVRKKHEKMVKDARKAKKKLMILNIPLLLETNSYKCDFIVAVIASKAIQKKRFLMRAKEKDPKNFTAEKKNLEKQFEEIALKQTSNAERKKKADFVIDASEDKKGVEKQVKKLIANFK
jgi:dephospho-CoA kinase